MNTIKQAPVQTQRAISSKQMGPSIYFVIDVETDFMSHVLLMMLRSLLIILLKIIVSISTMNAQLVS